MIWGNGLYCNDTSLDTRDEFVEYLREGMDTEAITSIMIEENEELLEDPFDGRMFWLALADTQWNWGRLLPEVKDKVLEVINGLKQLDPESLSEWERALSKKKTEKLTTKLLSTQPKPKTPRKQREYRCNWKLGDVYAMKFVSSRSLELGLYGKYMLFQKVDDYDADSKHVTPIVYVKITKNDSVPRSIGEYNELEYVQISFLRYEWRFIPIDGRRLEEDIKEKMKINYEVDEYGYLREFRLNLGFTSDKNIPSSMFYIGNFSGAALPDKEFVPHSKTNISLVYSKKMDEEIENEVILSYLYHNLKQAPIYQKDN